MKNGMKRLAAILILSSLGLAGGAAFAAEFEVLDRLSVDGYTVLRGSADIPGGSFAVGASTFVVKAGNVGIGTTAPGYKLDVSGTLNADTVYQGGSALASLYAPLSGGGNYVQLQAATPGAQQAGHLNISGSGLFGGNVGIGTTAPASQMHLYGPAGTGAPVIGGGSLYLQDSASSPNNGGSLLFGTNQGYWAGIKGFINNGNSYTVGNLGFFTRNAIGDASLTERMRILINGNIGVGTAVPDQKLAVAGSISATGQIISSGTANNYFAGNVGIGTTGPGAKLEVNTGGGGLASDGVYIYHSANSAYNVLNVLSNWGNGSGGNLLKIGNAGGTKIIVDNSGNVGIGTAAPTARLEVHDGNDSIALYRYSDNQLAIQTLLDGQSLSGYSYGGGQNQLLLQPLIGNVGIGTTAPAARLDVAGTANMTALSIGGTAVTATAAELNFISGVTSALQAQINTKSPIASPTFTGTVSGITSAMVGLGNVNNTGDTAKPVSTAQQAALDLKANLASPTFTGSVQIGSGNFTQLITHGNNARLLLTAANNGATSGDANLYWWISEPGMTWTGAGIARNMYNTTGFPRVNTTLTGQMIRFDEGTNILFNTETAAGTRYTPMYVSGNDTIMNGNVGIGIVPSTYKLQVNGQPAANGYTLFTNYSDRRLKENVRPLGGDVLKKLMLLKPSTFNYNGKYFSLTGYDAKTKNRMLYGFIAQELNEVFPDMVSEKEIRGEKYYDTNLSSLQIYLVEGIQELEKRVEALEKENRALKEAARTDTVRIRDAAR